MEGHYSASRLCGKAIVQSRRSRTTFAANVVLQATLRSERVRSVLLLPAATIPNPKLPWGVELRIRGLTERDEEGSAVAEPSFFAHVQCRHEANRQMLRRSFVLQITSRAVAKPMSLARVRSLPHGVTNPPAGTHNRLRLLLFVGQLSQHNCPGLAMLNSWPRVNENRSRRRIQSGR